MIETVLIVTGIGVAFSYMMFLFLDFNKKINNIRGRLNLIENNLDKLNDLVFRKR